MKQDGTPVIQSINLKQLINNLIHCFGIPGKYLESCDQCFFKDRSTKDCQCRDKLIMTTIIILYNLQDYINDGYIDFVQNTKSALSADILNEGINKLVDFLTHKANAETFESQLTNIYNMVKDNE